MFQFNFNCQLVSAVKMSVTLLGCTALLACSAKDPWQNLVQPSGFLQDYSKLRPSSKTEGAMAYINRSKKIEFYTMVMIDPVKIMFAPNSNIAVGKMPDKQKSEQLARFFEEELRAKLEGSYPIVNVPGFGVLRIRAAITDVEASNPLAQATLGLGTLGFGLGGAGVEAEFIDAQTGEVVAAFVDRRDGKKSRAMLATKKYGHAENRLSGYAQLLRDRLDESRGLHGDSMFRTSGSMFD